jgi:hypothetical protein
VEINAFPQTYFQQVSFKGRLKKMTVFWYNHLRSSQGFLVSLPKKIKWNRSFVAFVEKDLNIRKLHLYCFTAANFVHSAH